MEELREKAINYAEENVINVLKEAFAKVYADGYRDGYKDCEDEIPVDLRDGKTEYIDLGLPSGTLWSNDYERVDGKVSYLIYNDAENLKIPTVKQCQELLDLCNWECIISNGLIPQIKNITCVGPNGNKIQFRLTGFIKTEGVVYEGCDSLFWLKPKVVIESTGKAAILTNRDNNGNKSREFKKDVCDAFVGFKLPIRLVRTK